MYKRQGLTGTGAALKSGIGNLISNPMDTIFGGAAGNKGIPGLLKTATYSGTAAAPGTIAGTGSSVFNPGSLRGAPTGVMGKSLTTLAGLGGGAMPAGAGYDMSGQYLDPQAIGQQVFTDAKAGGATDEQAQDAANAAYQSAMAALGANPANAGSNASSASSGLSALNPFTNNSFIDQAFDTPDYIKNIGDSLGFGGSNPTPDFIKSISGGGSGGFGGKDIAALGLAGLLGKLAYDEAKNAKGVAQTPMTSMNAAGRYNIEAEIARRMGKEAPNPTEFGLLPANTLSLIHISEPTRR